MILSACQENAVEAFLSFIADPDNHELILGGHSGTGKSYLIKHLIELTRTNHELLQLVTGDEFNVNIELTATTNKAAAVLSEATFEPTSTIHSYLGLRVQNDYKTGKTILKKTGNYDIKENTLIFIDEASMIDKTLLQHIRDASKDCKIVYIGDPYQLAPVFESSCPAFNIPSQIRLQTIMRNQGPIGEVGQAYRKTVDTGVFPTVNTNGKELVHMDGTDFQNEIDKVFSSCNGSNHARILAWSNNRVIQYNEYVRGLYTQDPYFTAGEIVVANEPVLTPTKTIAVPTDQQATIISAKSIECSVDAYELPCMQYKLKSGLMSVTALVPKDRNQYKYILKTLAKEAKSSGYWMNYFTFKEAISDLRPIHASTVHKSQGSTYDTVFIDLDDIGRNNNPTEVARLLYVAITRAKNRVIFYGELPTKYGAII